MILATRRRRRSAAAPSGGGGIALPLFPNAPTTGGGITWVAYEEFWEEASVPTWGLDGVTYQGDNGSGLVNYGDDDPSANWGNQAAIVADATVPGEVGRALQITFPATLTGGYSSARIYRHPQGPPPANVFGGWAQAASTGHLYLGVYVWVQATFSQGSPAKNTGTKLIGAQSGLNPGQNHFPLNLDAGDPRTDACYQGFLTQTPFNTFRRVPMIGANDVSDGAWHLLEVLLYPNTPGVANGWVRQYVDTRLEREDFDLEIFSSAQTPHFDNIGINPVFGGGVNTPGQSQTIRIGPMRTCTGAAA